jgi:hypothetical protein
MYVSRLAALPTNAANVLSALGLPAPAALSTGLFVADMIVEGGQGAISYESPQTCLEKEKNSSSMTTSITRFPFRDMFEGSHS